MIIPMSRKEISTILDVEEIYVEHLWNRGELRRSIENEYRSCSGLRQSCAFDVLEYLLSAKKLQVTMSRELAALWVTNLAEVLDIQEFGDPSLPIITKALYDMSLEDGLCEMGNNSQLIAFVCVATFREIDQMCASIDGVLSRSMRAVMTVFEQDMATEVNA